MSAATVLFVETQGASSHDGRMNGSPHRQSVTSGFENRRETAPGSTNLGGLLGSLRPTPGPMKGSSVTVAGNRVGGTGMNAFRNSGPVKAHRSAAPEMFGADSGLRKSTRPATAPSTRIVFSEFIKNVKSFDSGRIEYPIFAAQIFIRKMR